MSKKKRKDPVNPAPVIDPNLEDVGEDRQTDIEYDEETNELLLVHHYRYKFGDPFEGDIEHGFNLVETKALIGTFVEILAVMETKNINDMLLKGGSLPHKPTPSLVENNPLDPGRASLQNMIQAEKEEKK